MKKYAFLLPLLLAAACNSGERITTTTVTEPYARIVEYRPAPGQFINDPASGFNDTDTPEAYAEKRLAATNYVSLGGWGGYITAAFATPVPATDGYDLWVRGNQMANASEPGVVYVAVDDNSDGVPDDGVWYALKGSEYGREGYIGSYSVTYHLPTQPQQDIAWTDSEGQSGVIDYLSKYHDQPSYFPAWERADLTFTGVCLPYNGTQGSMENASAWLLPPFEWGYADNLSTVDASGTVNRFRISDAMTSNGAPANLTSIGLIRIQTGVNGKSPKFVTGDSYQSIGETSTEVCGIGCYRTVLNAE